VQAPSSEKPVPLKLLRANAAASIKSVANTAAAASVTPDRAISGARAEKRAACAAQASERTQEQLRSRAEPSQPRRRASHPTGRSAVHAPSSEQPLPLKLLRESKSSFDRERSRRSCGGERHTRQGDQRCTRRAASGLCRSGLRVQEQQLRSRTQPTQSRRRASHPTGRSAVLAPSIERPVPLKPPKESKSSFDRERSRRS
jgi:hypothetical protein